MAPGLGGLGRRLGRLIGAGAGTSAGGPTPTMIVPAGAHLDTDEQGRLSIRTPGSLVLQASGTYGDLEAVGGSIRVEPGVRVEAATVRCADVCAVGGTLVAWRIVARELQVEAGAEASFVLRETRSLVLAPSGRIVGNFASEAELVGLFSRFAPQVRAIPSSTTRPRYEASLGPLLDVDTSARTAEDEEEPDAVDAAAARAEDLALVREQLAAARSGAKGFASKILGELERLVLAEDLDTLRSTWKVLFERLEPLDGDLVDARRRLGRILGLDRAESRERSE